MFNWFKKIFGSKIYYEIKCSYNYIAEDKAGDLWVVYTHPVKKIADIYKKEFKTEPLSFFDCGCGCGKLLVQAEEMGMKVQGIDIKEYCPLHPNIKIVSILEYEKPITQDLVYCNEVLSCLKEEELPVALNKFKNSKMVVAIHNTTDDDKKAGGTAYRQNARGPRLIKSQKWWIDCFNKNGFNAYFHKSSGCFVAKSRTHDD